MEILFLNLPLNINKMQINCIKSKVLLVIQSTKPNQSKFTTGSFTLYTVCSTTQHCVLWYINNIASPSSMGSALPCKTSFQLLLSCGGKKTKNFRMIMVATGSDVGGAPMCNFWRCLQKPLYFMGWWFMYEATRFRATAAHKFLRIVSSLL